MTEQRDENFDEKDREKREEKSTQEKVEEKQWEEKHRRDPLSPIIWGLILVWAGGVLLLANLGVLDNILRQIEGLPFWLGRLVSGWSLVLVGAGVILLGEALIRLLVPIYRRPIGGLVFLALVFIGIGLGDLISWNILWPLILIGLGVLILFRGFSRSRA